MSHFPFAAFGKQKQSQTRISELVFRLLGEKYSTFLKYICGHTQYRQECDNIIVLTSIFLVYIVLIIC